MRMVRIHKGGDTNPLLKLVKRMAQNDKKKKWEPFTPIEPCLERTSRPTWDYPKEQRENEWCNPTNLDPTELIDSMKTGKCHRDGFMFEYEGDTYILQRKQSDEPSRKTGRNPIPTPVEVGCGIFIDVIRDDRSEEEPLWRVRIYGGVYGGEPKYAGFIPFHHDPTQLPPAEVSEFIAKRILDIYPYPVCTMTVRELTQRVRKILSAARVGLPMSPDEMKSRGIER